MELKICTKCGKEKSVEGFGGYIDNRSNKHYYYIRCKVCSSEYNKQRYKDNKEQRSEYLKNNKERISERDRIYYEKHKEQYREYNKWWHENNKERRRKYYQDNRDYISKRNKQYKKCNKFKINALTAKRRAAKRQQTPDNADSSRIQYMYKVCDILNKSGNESYHVDHIKPLSKGGLHHEDNLQILIAGENLKKSNKITSKYKGLTLKECKKMMGDI